VRAGGPGPGRRDGRGRHQGQGERVDGRKLARRKAAQAKLQAEARARQEQAEAERAARIAKLAAEKDRLEGRAAEELARGQAKVARYARRAAAAAAGHGRRQSGRAPWPAEQQRDVRASAAASARAAARLEEAIAAPAVAPAPARPAKANVTDLASRVMPLKKGGYDQLHNLHALAGRRQVIFAVGTHPTTTGTTTLHPLLAAAAANLAAVGIADKIGRAGRQPDPKEPALTPPARPEPARIPDQLPDGLCDSLDRGSMTLNDPPGPRRRDSEVLA
jgi:hypothetical protein